MPYKVGQVIGFSIDISIMDRKVRVRVSHNTEVMMMRNKCTNQVAYLIIWSIYM